MAVDDEPMSGELIRKIWRCQRDVARCDFRAGRIVHSAKAEAPRTLAQAMAEALVEQPPRHVRAVQFQICYSRVNGRNYYKVLATVPGTPFIGILCEEGRTPFR